MAYVSSPMVRFELPHLWFYSKFTKTNYSIFTNQILCGIHNITSLLLHLTPLNYLPGGSFFLPMSPHVLRPLLPRYK
jgi:hypothetical protein